MAGIPPPAPQVASAWTVLLAGLILPILMASAAITRAAAPIAPSFLYQHRTFPLDNPAGHSMCQTSPLSLFLCHSPQQVFRVRDLSKCSRTRSQPGTCETLHFSLLGVMVVAVLVTLCQRAEQ